MLWQILSDRAGFWGGAMGVHPGGKGSVMRVVRGVLVAVVSISVVALSPALARTVNLN